MKLLHYCKVLLFSVPLNILVHNKNKSYITPKHTRNTRLLCECELYTSIYDNVPEMKAVMENYNRQTSQRLKEYDERMIKNRQKCKEKCNKEIQQIILKDKIEKELSQHFSALETNISTNDIPTCICEKSIADKMEKTCLKCTQNLGGIVAPSSVVLGGIAEFGLSTWKPKAIAAAIAAAKQAGLAKGLAEGEAVGFAKFIKGMESAFCLKELDVKLLESVFMQQKFDNFLKIADVIYAKYETTCVPYVVSNGSNSICKISETLKFNALSSQTNVLKKAAIADEVNKILAGAKHSSALRAADVTVSETATLEAAKKGAIETTYMGYQTTIIASIVAILVIVLIMVIIYLILRYRRKTKLKKKLQYIKLLKE
ncbi:PIR protein, putative [Plasmodium sp. gorilla clade G1]|nr:PIR protein, putative [Plasmodium sp. gorilla clade G1]